MLDYLAVKRVVKQAPTDNFISIELQAGFAPEAYSLKVSDKGVSIVAGDYGGAFCGVQTLMQLMPSDVYTKQMKLLVMLRMLRSLSIADLCLMLPERG